MKTSRTAKTCRLFLPVLLGLLVCSAPAQGLEPPPITPVDQFFVEHNGGAVQVPPPDWRLIVDGAVATTLELSLAEIMAYPSASHMATLECYGNPYAFKQRDLIGNAVWSGVPVSTILQAAGPLDHARSVAFTALDGYTVTLALESLLAHDDIILAYGMNGQEIPAEQGFPLRLVLPGMLGVAWVQWVSHITVTAADAPAAPPFIPLHGQVFAPQDAQTLAPKPHTIAGMVLVGEAREVTSVEVSTDGGSSWNAAGLLSEFVPNAWKHWEYSWEPPGPGPHRLAVRAGDHTGTVQERTGLFGWEVFSIVVNVDNDNESEDLPAATTSTTTTVRRGGGGGGSRPPATTTTSALATTSSTSTSVPPVPPPECQSSEDCDDGIFCNGAEGCLDGACAAGLQPCADNELCVEDSAACWEFKTVTAQGLPAAVLRPVAIAQRCFWLVLRATENIYADQNSRIHLEGPVADARGIWADPQRRTAKFWQYVFVPLCLEQSATPGWWSVVLETSVAEPDGPFIEYITARLEIR